MLALLGGATIVVVSRLRVNKKVTGVGKALRKEPGMERKIVLVYVCEKRCTSLAYFTLQNSKCHNSNFRSRNAQMLTMAI